MRRHKGERDIPDFSSTHKAAPPPRGVAPAPRLSKAAHPARGPAVKPQATSAKSGRRGQ